MKLRLVVIIVLVLGFVGLVVAYQNGWLGIVNPVKPVTEDTIPEDRFVQAYVELAILAETSPIGTPEYETEKARVLGGIGLTPAAVEKQLASYNDRPDLWRPIWDKIQTELQKRTKSGGDTTSAAGTN